LISFLRVCDLGLAKNDWVCKSVLGWAVLTAHRAKAGLFLLVGNHRSDILINSLSTFQRRIWIIIGNFLYFISATECWQLFVCEEELEHVPDTDQRGNEEWEDNCNRLH